MIKTSNTCRLVILISGNGTNLQAIIKACATKKFLATVVGVISNKSHAYGLQRAQNAGIPTYVVDHRDFNSRTEFDAALKEVIDELNPSLVILAGFMRILGGELVEHLLGRIMNIHPSLLPNYPGLNTHIQALKDGANEHGATVHFVTSKLDSGPIILQKRIPIETNDTPQNLAKRVHQCEHKIYPRVISWFADGRLKLLKDVVYLDGNPIDNRHPS